MFDVTEYVRHLRSVLETDLRTFRAKMDEARLEILNSDVEKYRKAFSTSTGFRWINVLSLLGHYEYSVRLDDAIKAEMAEYKGEIRIPVKKRGRC